MISFIFDFLFFPAKSADQVIATQQELIKILQANAKLQRDAIEIQRSTINVLIGKLKEKQ